MATNIAVPAGDITRLSGTFNANRRCVNGLSISLIVFGGVCFVLEIINLTMCRDHFPIGAGIWNGIFILVTGILGVFATSVKHQGRCLTISVMVMAIITAVVCAFGFSMAVINAVIWRGYCRTALTYIVPSVIALLIFLSLVFSILNSSYACCGTCPCCNENSNQSQNVYYMVPANQGMANQGQVLFVPAGSQIPQVITASAYPAPPQQFHMPNTLPGGMSSGGDSPPPAYVGLDYKK